MLLVNVLLRYPPGPFLTSSTSYVVMVHEAGSGERLTTGTSNYMIIADQAKNGQLTALVEHTQLAIKFSMLGIRFFFSLMERGNMPCHV